MCRIPSRGEGGLRARRFVDRTVECEFSFPEACNSLCETGRSGKWESAAAFAATKRIRRGRSIAVRCCVSRPFRHNVN